MIQEPIPDEKLKEFLQALYNVWFEKWKRKRMTDQDWSQCIKEIDCIMLQGERYPFVEEISMALLRELERRNK